ncbi:hypothetical protein [Myroides odoratimimus]|uniref:hypothetical protein n=1 Tax=Myroides odoratimimus TaxID=76832 RepID=UPI0025750ABF|nr:hypothetical protein [Myroides odoratimimus]MDM1513583.1 hypothetical protein [Myroides odoratimimus]
MAKKSNKQHLADWQEFRNNIRSSTQVDLQENPIDKIKRIERLEKDDEEWFAYYFPNFYTSEPAPFHKKSTKKVMQNMELYLVRSWSRELAKSARTMMETLKLGLTGKKSNIILVSNSFDNAVRLLAPYRIILESNQRIINDYGEQASIGQWEAAEFITKQGVAFRALGAGQSPRGTRKDAKRPDLILIDDIDTDEECRNPERIRNKVNWIEQALIPTRSISNPLMIIACGNIIAKFCCITEMAKKADAHEIVNIRGKEGKSTWPTKNTEEDIDRVLKQISYNSAQKEYFNNPVSEGEIFKEIYWDRCPPLQYCERVVAYADPATSNKDKGNSSTKGVVIVGYKAQKYYVYTCWLDTMRNSKFVEALFNAYDYLEGKKVDVKRLYIENNSLQDPFYEQVLIPLIRAKEKERNNTLPLTPDERKKPEKFFRIEGTLEPLHRNGQLIFNSAEKNNPHMERLEQQMLGVSEKAKMMDGPDMVEGAISMIAPAIHSFSNTYVIGRRINNKY